jgi:hypothetical protein
VRRFKSSNPDENHIFSSLRYKDQVEQHLLSNFSLLVLITLKMEFAADIKWYRNGKFENPD